MIKNDLSLDADYMYVFFVFQHIRLKAGFALSIFAFNNTPQQFAIREAGGIKYECFENFMESDSAYEQCNAAFQVMVYNAFINYAL